MKCRCDDCAAPDQIKQTIQCGVDQLCNRGEILKHEILALLGIKYKPAFSCGCADLIETMSTDEIKKKCKRNNKL